MANDRWVLTWKREKNKGHIATQRVVVYGIENVEHVAKAIVPPGVNWDLIPS